MAAREGLDISRSDTIGSHFFDEALSASIIDRESTRVDVGALREIAASYARDLGYRNWITAKLIRGVLRSALERDVVDSLLDLG
jgi:hypothetical protein